MARLFVAVDFPDEIVSALERCQPVLQPGIRCSSRDQLHLTLHFLGDALTERMAVALQSIRLEPFSLTIEGVGFFEGKNRTTILWASIRQNDNLSELHRKVANSLAVEGFQPETRSFSPHVTLARCSGDVQASVIRAFLNEHAGLRLPDVCVDHVALYSSTLTDRGPKYQCEKTVPLTSGGR